MEKFQKHIKNVENWSCQKYIFIGQGFLFSSIFFPSLSVLWFEKTTMEVMIFAHRVWPEALTWLLYSCQTHTLHGMIIPWPTHIHAYPRCPSTYFLWHTAESTAKNANVLMLKIIYPMQSHWGDLFSALNEQNFFFAYIFFFQKYCGVFKQIAIKIFWNIIQHTNIHTDEWQEERRMRKRPPLYHALYPMAKYIII